MKVTIKNEGMGAIVANGTTIAPGTDKLMTGATISITEAAPVAGNKTKQDRE